MFAPSGWLGQLALVRARQGCATQLQPGSEGGDFRRWRLPRVHALIWLARMGKSCRFSRALPVAPRRTFPRFRNLPGRPVAREISGQAGGPPASTPGARVSDLRGDGSAARGPAARERASERARAAPVAGSHQAAAIRQCAPKSQLSLWARARACQRAKCQASSRAEDVASVARRAPD